MDDTLKMMQELTEAPGISGFEEPVRRVMRRYMEPLSEILTDNLGSIVGRKVGQEGGPKILLAGHMDEIGFIVTRITYEDYYNFQIYSGSCDKYILTQHL